MTLLPPDSSILREAAARAIGEDRGPADITSLALFNSESSSSAKIFTKEEGVLAGLPVAEHVFREIDPQLKLTCQRKDSDFLQANDVVLIIEGSTRSILTAERTALNFLQHLSAVATCTKKFVDAVSHTSCNILDTRKTVPGLRHLQKYAVRCGGGENHRFGLYDAFMIKDNHISLTNETNTLEEAIQKARAFDPDAKLIVEADTLEQVKVILEQEVEQILLDNMSCEEMKEAVSLKEKSGLSVKLEASGNITLDRAAQVAETGVDYISVGALTHSVQALDFSLEIPYKS